MSKEVLIVGAGPTGLVLAISLSRYGIPFVADGQNLQVVNEMIRKFDIRPLREWISQN